MTCLMEECYVQNGGEVNVWSSRGGRKNERCIHRGGDDELLGAEKWPEVLVKIVLLLPGPAAGRRPELHRAGCDAHVGQSGRADRHQHHAGQDHG